MVKKEFDWDLIKSAKGFQKKLKCKKCKKEKDTLLMGLCPNCYHEVYGII